MAADGPRPLILVRGFGGLDVSDEQGNAYQGFNDGTVYPGRRGENYIYEGFVLRALKSERYRYRDATNVIGYYSVPVEPPATLHDWDPAEVGGTVVIDPASASRVLREAARGTIWVYRYYDLDPRTLTRYGEGLARLVRLVRRAVERHEPGSFDGVDILAHSMGGLVVREALLAMQADEGGSAPDLVNRVVTLGTPHRGIAFQRVPRWLLESLPRARADSDELAAFSPASTRFLELEKCFPVDRILTVVGTDYRSYGRARASAANRLIGLLDEGSLATNRSDGLVKQSAAQLPGAPRTFVHKCHGGPDSLVTSREAYEITMRFLHGSHRIRLWLDTALIERGKDWFGDSEFYLGVTIKPRYVDFELFHQGGDAENCYGPFARPDLSDVLPDLATELRRPLAERGDATTGWAGPDRLIWEGWVDPGEKPDPDAPGVVLRLGLYVAERDGRGIGFSDNVIFSKQYYLQVFPGETPDLYLHTGEQYLGSQQPLGRDELAALAQSLAANGVRAAVSRLERRDAPEGTTWVAPVGGTGFTGALRIAFDPA